MSVLSRKELEESPLADLHTIASELGLEGFRAKRKSDLIDSILAASGSESDVGEDSDPDEVPAAETLEAPAEDEAEDTSEGTSEDTSEGTSEDTSEGTSEGTS